MSFFTLGRLKNHKITHLHSHSTMCMSRTKLQLKINNFFQLHVSSNYSLQGVNQSVLQICVMKIIFLLRQTAVDSDFTQNFKIEIWQVESLVSCTIYFRPLKTQIIALYQLRRSPQICTFSYSVTSKNVLLIP